MATLKPEELDTYGDLIAVALTAAHLTPGYDRQLRIILRDIELAKRHRGRVRFFEVELPTLRPQSE